MGHVTLLTLHRFASPNVVHPYLLLLKSYSRNTAHTNHCIARMLHRLAVNLKMDALLFQLSIFNLFNKILSDPAAAAYTVQKWLGDMVGCRLDTRDNLYSLLDRSWWPLPSMCWTVSLLWQLGTIRRMLSCCSGKMSGLYMRWLRATAKMGWWSLFCICQGFVLFCHNTTFSFYGREGKRPTWTEEEEEELRKLYDEHRHSEGLLSFLFAHLFCLLYGARYRCTMYWDLGYLIYSSSV